MTAEQSLSRPVSAMSSTVLCLFSNTERLQKEMGKLLAYLRLLH